MIVKNISSIKKIILELIDLRESKFHDHITNPNLLWKKWVTMLSFIFDLSEDSLQKIRLHTGFGFFLGSNWSSVYYEKNEIELGICTFEKSKTINDYINLTKNVEKKFWCSEIDKNKDLISIKYNG